MKRENAVRLYNVMFPIWLFFLFPSIVWLWLLPANFVIDSLVLLAAAAYGKYAEKKNLWKKSILRVWIIGFLADMAGALVVLAVNAIVVESFPGNWGLPPLEQLSTLPGILVAGILIYVWNRKFSFRKTNLEADQIHGLSLALAIVTAPYTMLIPTAWLYY